MKNSTLLIEIGCEELPARQLEKIHDALFDNFIAIIKAEGVEVSAVKKLYTPRRLSLLCHTCLQLPDQKINKLGPFLKQAVDDKGQPNHIGLGFAKSCGVDFNELNHQGLADNLRLQYIANKPGELVETKIVAWLSQAKNKMHGVKMMRWHDLTVEFPRPVHWVVVRLGDKVLPGEFLGVPISAYSYGHRFMSKGAFLLQNNSNYINELKSQYVLVEPLARKQQILKEIENIIPKNMQAEIPADLLAEVLGLVEWPVPLLCEFSADYLGLPVDLLISVMRVHQKCFPVRCKSTGKLQPFFITVANIQSKNLSLVASGNQKVMAARLADAQFFFAADKKVSLLERNKQLSHVVFQSSLGSLLAKVLRVQNLAVLIAKELALDEEIVSQIAGLSKADLCTETVGEFPSLHAIIGSELARLSGSSSAVVDGIKEHIYPRFAHDRIPATKYAKVVALADKIDTLVGFFSIQIIPTGDKDPYGLRRAAMALVRIMLEGELPLDLHKLLLASQQSYGNIADDSYLRDLSSFIIDRFRAWWSIDKEDSLVFDAVEMNSLEDLSLCYAKMIALKKFMKSEYFLPLLQVSKRVENFLRKQDKSLIKPLKSQELILPVEKELYQKVQFIHEQAISLLANNDYLGLLQLVASISSCLSKFFEGCLVLDEDLAVRKKRLALLVAVQNLLNKWFKINVLSAKDAAAMTS